MRKYPVRAYHYLRFSTPTQRTGNSTERQIEWAREWCEGRKIALDDTLKISDPGVSAFRGKNRKQGGLSNFLAACRQGRVRKGSYLLVESADRLSREHPLDGFSLVKELLSDFGVVIVTKFPEQEFSRSNFDRTGWLLQAEFQRAYSESLAKSERSKFNWKKRRERAGEQPITARLPKWLTMAGGKIVLDPKKAAVVRRIYDMSVKGFGQKVIADRLRADGVPPMGRGIGWHESDIQRVLTSRAVLGEFQPCVMREGVRVPDGELRQDYYPRVISDAVWEQSRQAMRGRRHQRGRITRKVSNLFTGLVFEGGLPCSHVSKDDTGYLQPLGRRSPGVVYHHFERLLLWFVRSVKVSEADATEYDTLKARADRLAAAVLKLQAQIDADPGMADMLPTLAKWKKDHREAVEKMEAAAVPVQARHLHSIRLVEALAKAKGEELETLRREIRQAVRQVIERIDVTVVSRKRPLPQPDVDALKLDLPAVLPPSWRIVRLSVKLHSGGTHHIVYVTTGTQFDGSRLAGGVHLGTSDGESVDCFDPQGEFPTDPLPAETLERNRMKEKVQKLRAAGKTYGQIAEATDLNVTTVWRYISGKR